jgi:hypothetical protein
MPTMACHLNPNKPQWSKQEGNADSKTDSETERKQEKMGDTRRQSSTNQKPLGRSRGHPGRLLANSEK